ncbi:serine/threonine protein kinase [Polyangium jinanense]|uniref:Protein kinase n=1 Tax=Polyangium jinanense TaxID=2829994 RepID=A0A9X4ATP9_9BACT|nr:serine/threonine protein kinase [Polyangium jinanense]MDC3961667.1 protein kinase [Polyangium jinanense]MDC3983766.1 protein kinase [Polyangium jinanense]
MEDRELWERRIGTTLRDTWRLESLIGVGGMAAVYVGAQQIGRRDAVKILHPEVARQKDLRARFEQEARVLSSFRHPGAVEVLYMGTTEDGLPFIVMELLEGESLAARFKRLGSIPVDEMLKYVDEVLSVLGAAHAQNIVHRDIKLDNVFVLNTGHVKVLDFGIARLRNSQHAVQTKIGSMLGTLPYMPPEQIRGVEIDGRADLFALGSTMFRLLAKRRIHEGTTEAEILVKMSTEPAPPLATLVKDVSPQVCMVVDRALAFRTDRRYPDAATMQRDVRALLRGEPPPYALEKLAAGELPTALITTPAAAPTNVDLGEAPTVPPPPMGADAPTAAGIGIVMPGAISAPTAVSAVTSVSPPSNPTGTGPRSATAAQANASILYGPTVMASVASLGLSEPTPPPATNPSRASLPSTPTGAPAAPPQRASEPTPAPASPAHTPPPMAKSLIGMAPAAPSEPRKIPLIPALIGALVCLILLFVGIAVFRGHDEPSTESGAGASTSSTKANAGSGAPTTGTESSKKSKKRNWDKVNWDK